ncbi:MAG: Valyl-tRNA synthetase [Candidatus Methanohalarchaeum thermophilum]|uniref:Valine--tRNA ligase n=1 Tax=Methanohalarchaeum thermophilum TaxID=1903181 RepID=A0A1Q6DV01_METT1|nr:MAG: Valyl-tRNA synthetase [Candidatus Methanohalarchaeum thermophilum]
MMPKEFESEKAESKWYDEWNENSIYEFDRSSDSKKYVIDTPPPYPTGDFHAGNALNWCYIDFVARYKRMRGYDVMFPQGWDCHGLPTEVKVEEIKGITKNDVDRSKFREYCKQLTHKNIGKMKETMGNLGFSVDWSQEYITMDPDYWSKTQLSFVEMYKNDEIYQRNHPVNWCPRCETAIAYAEVEHEKRKTKLNYLDFSLDNGSIEIATTRPELLPACGAVAVHPEDDRFKKYIGKKAKVPLFDQEVDIISDEDVDPEFGTGAVMVCTFGDKQDVEWWNKYDLPLRQAISPQGKLTDLADEYKGLKTDEAKEQIIQDLEEKDYLVDQEEIEQSVGTCWRCSTPIEIISEKQWFVEVNNDEILETAKTVNWIPEHMYLRLENWVNEMEWDWCISRQRIFGTPIPVWYCKNCGDVILAKEENLPINPTEEDPEDKCSCESPEIIPETDVLDTWMDSSISALHVAGWPEEKYKENYPVQLRPQGHDIIRTWAFYTILRSAKLTDEKPWDDILINGMVFGEDGNKMSKSLGNIVPPEEVIEEENADSFRLWAALGGSPGSDIQFKWKDVKAANKFLRKTWNVLRFTLMNIELEKMGNEPEEYNLSDKWILAKLDEVLSKYKKNMDEYKFKESVELVKSFLWEDLADNYVEMVKWRLYGEKDYSAQYSLFKSIDSVLKMIAPFAPFFAEEAFSNYSDGFIHNSLLPDLDIYHGEEAINRGEILRDIVKRIRRYKSNEGIPLNEELKLVDLYNSPSFLKDNVKDIANTIWAKNLSVNEEPPNLDEKVVDVSPDMSYIGPKYKQESNEIVERLEEMELDEIKEKVRSGEIDLSLSDREITLPRDAVIIKKKPYYKGEEVDILEIEGRDIIITVSKN